MISLVVFHSTFLERESTLSRPTFFVASTWYKFKKKITVLIVAVIILFHEPDFGQLYDNVMLD